MDKKNRDYKQQANQYDKIWRENMHAALPGIIKNVLSIHVAKSRNLPDKILVTKQREVDTLQEVTDVNGNTFILHVEIQVKNEKDMVYRMAEYRIMIERLYRLPVKQYVIYLGNGKSTMASSLHSEGLHFEYNLLIFKDIPYRLLLSSDQPEERLLAILADFGKEEPEAVITNILHEVRVASKDGFSENRYLQQLRILIQLRNLAKQFNQAMETISKFFKVEKDPLFQKGKEEGKGEGKTEIIRNLIIKLGFNDEQAAEIGNVSIDFVKNLRASLIEK